MPNCILKLFSLNSIYLSALALLLLSCISSHCFAQEPSKYSSDTIDGKVLFLKLCADCHGLNGNPPSSVKKILKTEPRNLATDKLAYGESYDSILQVISEGIGNGMLAYGNRLSPAQLSSLTNYVLNLRKKRPTKN